MRDKCAMERKVVTPKIQKIRLRLAEEESEMFWRGKGSRNKKNEEKGIRVMENMSVS